MKFATMTMTATLLLILITALAGCNKQFIKPIQDYIDENVKVFQATDANMAKLIRNRRSGRDALLKISKRPQAAKDKKRADSERLIKAILKGRKLELQVLKGLKKIVGSLAK